ncbi:hypothetical protein HHX47_DHR7000329 [Lentinula edodes]|nr:hypothetical protein HHX47_DHR7000329 [Lentinula edodes]
MTSKDKDGPSNGHYILKASTIARAHTIFAYTAFTSALALGLLLHYKKIVKNGIAGYPEEWFPSVSATIGDWYPERNVFQIVIALTSGSSVIASAFFLAIVPLVYFFIQHKVYRIPGAYTHYSFFEWGLIFFDVLYDACAEEEFRLNNLHVAIGDLKSVNGSAAPT